MGSQVQRTGVAVQAPIKPGGVEGRRDVMRSSAVLGLACHEARTMEPLAPAIWDCGSTSLPVAATPRYQPMFAGSGSK
jgi:hypothetical protein